MCQYQLWVLSLLNVTVFCCVVNGNVPKVSPDLELLLQGHYSNYALYVRLTCNLTMHVELLPKSYLITMPTNRIYSECSVTLDGYVLYRRKPPCILKPVMHIKTCHAYSCSWIIISCLLWCCCLCHQSKNLQYYGRCILLFY